MGNSLSPYQGVGVGLSRRVQRELSRMNDQNQVDIVRIDNAAALNAERVSAIAYVGKRAMHEVAMISEVETQLSTMVPAASGRLQGIANVTALSMAETVAETVRRVR